MQRKLSNARDEVLEPLRAYVRGHATGNPDHFRTAFLPTAHVEGMRDGEFVSWKLNDYCTRFIGSPATDEPSGNDSSTSCRSTVPLPRP